MQLGQCYLIIDDILDILEKNIIIDLTIKYPNIAQLLLQSVPEVQHLNSIHVQQHHAAQARFTPEVTWCVSDGFWSI